MAALAAARHAKPGARSSSAPSTRTPRSRRPAACSSSSSGPGGRRVSAPPRRARPVGRLCRRGHGRDDVDELGRPGPAVAAACEREGSGCTSTPPTPARPRSARASRRLRRLGARRLGRRQPAQVAAHADGLLGALDAPAGRPPRRLQPRARVPARQRGGGEPVRVQLRARAAVPRAQALGRAALLRPGRAPGPHPRGDPPRGALRVAGPGRAGLGGGGAAALLARLLPARRRRRENEALLERVNERRDLPLAHATERALRASARGRQRTTEDDVRLAWGAQAGSGSGRA